MGYELTVIEKRTVEVAYLKASCGVRYWEDAKVNGVEDTDGSLIPLRRGDRWEPTIELASGRIVDWPEGVTADVHYKVCDAGVYTLLDADRKEVKAIEGYVPKIMWPGGPGYGDYVIMQIDGTGKIKDWRVRLDEFEAQDD